MRSPPTANVIDLAAQGSTRGGTLAVVEGAVEVGEVVRGGLDELGAPVGVTERSGEVDRGDVGGCDVGWLGVEWGAVGSGVLGCGDVDAAVRVGGGDAAEDGVDEVLVGTSVAGAVLSGVGSADGAGSLAREPGATFALERVGEGGAVGAVLAGPVGVVAVGARSGSEVLLAAAATDPGRGSAPWRP